MPTNWNDRSAPADTWIDRSVPSDAWIDRSPVTDAWDGVTRDDNYTFLLKEDAAYLLLENGGKIILWPSGWNDRSAVTDSWTDRTQI